VAISSPFPANDPIGDQKRALAEAITDRQYQLHPALDDRYGLQGRIRRVEDAEYHLSYLAESIAVSTPALFTDYMIWARTMLEARGIPAQDLAVNLEIMREVLVNSLPKRVAGVAARTINTALRGLRHSAPKLPPLLSGEQGPLADLTRDFLAALLRGERHVASRIILNAVQAGTSIRDIYLRAFQPSQREVGRLWQMNEINVAQEHYCTAATQLIMSQLYQHIFTGQKAERTVIAACVAGDLHEIGARMVADLMEMDGWNTIYLGANVPSADIVKLLEQHEADILALSVTMTFHIRAVANLIRGVRESAVGSRVKIMVGGHPFNVASELWRRVGADATAEDGFDALSIADRLVKGAAQ
jgi:MerR family transcriptional regulator, light-induced transcriptional regulator